jgi:hypothetical protein
MKNKMFGFGVIALMTAALIAVPARATSLQHQLDFSGGVGGSLGFTTAIGNPFVVTDANVSALFAEPSGAKLPVTDGTLSFMTAGCLTGCFATEIGKTGKYQTNATFYEGGTLTIVGEIPGMTAPETLLMGTFALVTDPLTHKPAVPHAALSSKTGTGGFSGTLGVTGINPQIYTDFLPLMFQNPTGGGNGFLSELTINLSFLASAPVVNHNTVGTWSGNIKSSDLIVRPTPEAPSLLLLGSALVAVAGFLRRKLNLVS